MINIAAAIMKLLATVLCTLTASLRAADFDLAAIATNQLGVDLHRQLARGEENLCLSPYSIQSALAMTFGGAEGDTRVEMARVLQDRKSTRLNSSHRCISYAVFCLKKKNNAEILLTTIHE